MISKEGCVFSQIHGSLLLAICNFENVNSLEMPSALSAGLNLTVDR